MMLKYCLDTSVVSEPAKPEPDTGVLEHLRAHAGETAIPSVVWHELTYGVERLEPGRRHDYLADYLVQVVYRSHRILPYSEEAALWHARERARLERLGRPRPFADGMIAATATAYQLVLVTRDAGHFASYHGLKIETWHSRP